MAKIISRIYALFRGIISWKYLNNPIYNKNEKGVINHFANHYKNEMELFFYHDTTHVLNIK